MIKKSFTDKNTKKNFQLSNIIHTENNKHEDVTGAMEIVTLVNKVPQYRRKRGYKLFIEFQVVTLNILLFLLKTILTVIMVNSMDIINNFTKVHIMNEGKRK